MKPTVKVLKGKKLLEELPQDSEDVFYLSKFQVYLLRPEELRDITSNSDSDTDCIEKGDFCECLSYATARKRQVSALKKRLQAHLHTVSTDGQFTAILTKLEKMKCPLVASVLSNRHP